MRKSLMDIAHMVRPIPYPKPLPEELEHLHCYLVDCGHNILCVPKSMLNQALDGDVFNYEVPIPVRYVLEKGWEHIPCTDAITVDFQYDDDIGAVIPFEYDEY